MKRHGHLWEGMIAFESLHRAAEKARRGKRFRHPAARFFFHLERELWRLHEELATKTYRPGPYRTFFICEPKRRQISAAPFRDRVVHHALTGMLEPIFERSFIHDSYACRKGKGTHAAVDRCQEFARRFRYVLKADVRKFFPSIDHEILKGLVARKVKDPHVLWLVDRIIDHSNPQDPVLAWFPGDDLFTPIERRRGLPLGNQTSQFFANVYLDPLDHFVTDRLGLSYVRYGVFPARLPESIRLICYGGGPHPGGSRWARVSTGNCRPIWCEGSTSSRRGGNSGSRAARFRNRSGGWPSDWPRPMASVAPPPCSASITTA
ncbi:MAG TPA: reverse transcriptase/maturase family protein [Isosphaeraceae bacterium]|nr:reverse transcriptase/maturase family protein [Isosphaeraceae bacterium]